MVSTWVMLLGAQVRVGGNRFRGRYVEAGAGEPVVLLHGQGGHAENFARNIMPLARHFHVFALDCVWHALGPQPPFNPALLPTYVEQVVDFLDWQGIPSAHVVGQSMGGWTAMRLAYEHPDRVRKLVLVTTQGFTLAPKPGQEPIQAVPGAASLQQQLTFLNNPTLENIRQRMVGLLARPERLTDEAIAIRHALYNIPHVNRSLQQVVRNYMGGPDSAPRKYVMTERELAQVKAPTLVYWADQNPVPPAAGEALARAIPGARYYCSADCGHWAQFEHADEFNREALRFLTGDASLEPAPLGVVGART